MIDLHCHIDGAVSISNARQLAQMQGITIPETDDELGQLIHVAPDCRNLMDFLEKFPFICSLLQDYKALKQCTINILNEFHHQGILYAELRYAPQLHTLQGMTQEDSIRAVIEGVKESPIPSGIILCCMRGEATKPQNMETIHLAGKYLGKGVCALDLAGGELPNSIDGYAYLFEEAGKLGVPVTVHVGEAAGADEVHRALKYHPARIGHGIHSYEDPSVLKELKDLQTPLEICITSNLQTCVVPSYEAYPLRKLLDAGVYVTINTDDPGIEGTTLEREWQLARKYFALTYEECRKLTLNAINASFASPELKAWLKRHM